MGKLDVNAISIATSIYRIAQGLRNKMEREVLASQGLSWTAFSLLYDLWIWKSMETRKLAESAGVSKATISNITNTLERKGLCYRKQDGQDKRLTYVSITDQGVSVMEELYPMFHQAEIGLVSMLNADDRRLMSDKLRVIIRGNGFEKTNKKFFNKGGIT
ncbi:MarR family winged helix-turn-helix transcriptional regulator [Paenibacillus tarimensis]|uniref:MarR family winged helix-turn-helix transcriptional regulator n=1 Tax=Paenibacillus tarimensis TaxID=416012 RepID=UPI001F2E3139|nr:MarR family transcriptional regulator [Paenibacillus tarimensis]MCF2944306.1 MarR family transcriptional regulator [Paenibacillus tarimensis]